MPSSISSKELRGDATWQTIAGSNAKAYITETWVSGTSWYRKWSDGWIEQGGTLTNGWSDANHTISLHKAFTTTSYNALVSCNYNGESKYIGPAQSVISKSTTSSVDSLWLLIIQTKTP